MNDLPADADNPGEGDAADVSVTSTYDAVPYSVGAFPQTHPERLATIARLFGVDAPSPCRCRVLELGCASGGNLIPMAATMPDATFVGIDLSRRQIDDGRAVVRELGLANIDLRAMSILDITTELGTFDYVLAHGVYSWVPPAVQEKILRIARDHLSPHGVAYVSYNCYPGWHARGAVREMLWYHTQHQPDPRERIRQARALLLWMTTVSRGDEGGGFGALLRQELALLLRVPDTYLLHEHLEEFNEPLYFHQFAQRAATQGLKYLAEAQVSAMLPSQFGADSERGLRALAGPDQLRLEQYMDFLRNRMFRQTLLVHREATLATSLRTDAVKEFHLASMATPAVEREVDVRSVEPVAFKAGRSTTRLSTTDPVMKAAMLRLGRAWPASVSFPELLEGAARDAGADASPAAADTLAARLLNCYAVGLAEFSTSPAPFTTAVSPRPIAAPYVRLRAGGDGRVMNLRLEGVTLGEMSRLVLTHLDGSHDHAALADLVERQLRESGSPAKSRAAVDAYVAELLAMLAKAAVLTG